MGKKKTEAPYRVKVLKEASKLTNGNRDAEYGPPSLQQACAGELKATFRCYLERWIEPGEQNALDMVMEKLSRLATGQPKRDTYVDAAAYMAIAAECALS